ncbi:MAG: hypothetical protein HQL56_14085 [Magnetococcales bacterium]|nr:hypothetical protein [Magnetococcales bacterium]
MDINENDYISVIDVASQFGKKKTTIFKIIARLGIEKKNLQSPNRHGQMVSYIPQSSVELIQNELVRNIKEEDYEGINDSAGTVYTPDKGVFYFVLLEPDHDPCRFKVGFAVNLAERLRDLKCSAPFLREMKTWPCKRLWEKTAIDCVSNGCEQLNTEVFRAASIESVLDKCEAFFRLMPTLER